MKVKALVFDCRCGGFDIVSLEVPGASSMWRDERIARAKREFHNLHDGDRCNYGYQEAEIDVPDAVLPSVKR